MDQISEAFRYSQSHCSQLRENRTCSWKDDIKMQLCTTNPNQCCAWCDDCETNCDSKTSICTILF